MRTGGALLGALALTTGVWLASACNRGDPHQPARNARDHANSAAERSAEVDEKPSQEQLDLAAAQKDVQESEQRLREAQDGLPQAPIEGSEVRASYEHSGDAPGAARIEAKGASGGDGAPAPRQPRDPQPSQSSQPQP